MKPNYITNIYLEMTPNPSTLKFAADRFISQTEGVEFDRNTPRALKNTNNLIQVLLNFPFIERIFVLENYISITKNQDLEWMEIQEQLRVLIKEHLQEVQWAFLAEEYVAQSSPILAETQKAIFEPSEHDQTIIDLLQEYVQPAVSNDGGEIVFAGLKEGIVFVQMRGACNGCPSSTATLKDGIERLMKQMLPDLVKEVRAII